MTLYLLLNAQKFLHSSHIWLTQKIYRNVCCSALGAVWLRLLFLTLLTFPWIRQLGTWARKRIY